MNFSFKLSNTYYGDKESCGFKTNMYHRVNVTLSPGVTVLVGCNGSGKTTFLRQLKDNLEKNEIPFVFYDNLKDGGANGRGRAGVHGDFNFLASAMISSEGEEIDANIGRFAAKIGYFMYNKVNPLKNKQAFVLFDSVDSGFSIDHIVSLKEDLFKLMLADANGMGIDLYIVISTNSYEIARGESCLDVYNGEYKKFNNYEDYRNFVLMTRERKNKRYGT